MLAEILGVSVPAVFAAGHEQDSAADFIEEFNQKQNAKVKDKRSSDLPKTDGTKMEHAETGHDY